MGDGPTTKQDDTRPTTGADHWNQYGGTEQHPAGQGTVGSDHHNQFGDPHSGQTTDGLQGVREQISTPGVRPEAAQKPADWRDELAAAVTDRNVLNAIVDRHGAVRDDHNHVFDADQLRQQELDQANAHFFNALRGATVGANGATAQMFTSLSKIEHVDQKLAQLHSDLKDVLPKYGLDKDKLTNQDVQQAILHYYQDHPPTQGQPPDETGKRLTEYLSLMEMKSLAGTQANDAFLKQKAPMMVALTYANFLLENNNGIGMNPATGERFTAADILLNVTQKNPEMAALPQAQDTRQQAESADAKNQRLIVPDEQNPFVTMAQANAKLVEAAKKQDPKELQQSHDMFQQAYNQAQDKQFDPDAIQKKIDAVKAEPDSPQKTAKLAALDQFSHVRSMTAGCLGLSELQQPHPDTDKALGLLMDAGKDKYAMEHLLDARGQSLIKLGVEGLEMQKSPGLSDWIAKNANDKDLAAVADKGLISLAVADRYATQHPEAGDWAKATQSAGVREAYLDCLKDMNIMDAYQAKSKAEQEKKGPAVTADDTKKANDAMQDAYNKAEALQKALAPYKDQIDGPFYDLAKKKATGKLTDEEKQQFDALSVYHNMLHLRTGAAISLSVFDDAKGDPHAAKALLDEAGNDTRYVGLDLKDQFDKERSINRGNLEALDPWYKKPFDWAWDAGTAVVDWAKDHPKILVAAGAIGGAVAATILTGGLAAETLPAAIAWGAGAVAGTAVGTGVGMGIGGGLELANGQAGTFWEGAKDSAPLAFQAASIGSLGAEFAAPAIAGEAAAGGTAASAGFLSRAGTWAATRIPGAARVGEMASNLPGAARIGELSSNFFEAGSGARFEGFANMAKWEGVPSALRVPLAAGSRFGTIAAVSGLPYAAQGDYKGYADYVATGAVAGFGLGAAPAGAGLLGRARNFGGNMLRFGAADSIKNAAFASTDDGDFTTPFLTRMKGDMTARMVLGQLPLLGRTGNIGMVLPSAAPLARQGYELEEARQRQAAQQDAQDQQPDPQQK